MLVDMKALVVLAAVLLAACSPATSSAPSPPASPAAGPTASALGRGCALVDGKSLGALFGFDGITAEERPEKEFLGGVDYGCEYQAGSPFSMSVSIKSFPASQPPAAVVDGVFARQPGTQKISGVGDAAAYVQRGPFVQFVAVEQSGSTTHLIHLLGKPPIDQVEKYATLARQVFGKL